MMQSGWDNARRYLYTRPVYISSDLTKEPVLETGTQLLEPGYPDSILVNK